MERGLARDTFNDYYNELARVGIDSEGKIRRRNRMRSIEERFADDENVTAILEAIREYPEKISLIDKNAEILNETEDVEEFKSAYNDMLRLIYGKDVQPMFPEP